MVDRPNNATPVVSGLFGETFAELLLSENLLKI